jgi:hypothetical protein
MGVFPDSDGDNHNHNHSDNIIHEKILVISRRHLQFKDCEERTQYFTNSDKKPAII